MKVNILISTIDSNINNVRDIFLPFREDLSYIISHQYTNENFKKIPEGFSRKDIKIVQIPGKGLSRSRNNAIKNADGTLCIVADDDVRYTNQYIDIIKRTYENNVVDVACFKIKTRKNEPEYKKYPSEERCFDKKEYPHISSIEITFRLSKIQENKIKFDERFGIGSKHLIGGEEKVLINDCLDSGLKVCYFNEYIVEHPYLSNTKTYSRYHKKRNLVEGAIDARINGIVAILKSILITIKIWKDLKKNNKFYLSYLYQRLTGVLYILISKD